MGLPVSQMDLLQSGTLLAYLKLKCQLVDLLVEQRDHRWLLGNRAVLLTCGVVVIVWGVGPVMEDVFFVI